MKSFVAAALAAVALGQGSLSDLDAQVHQAVDQARQEVREEAREE